jgi:uncharacterized protein (DUF169 family)
MSSTQQDLSIFNKFNFENPPVGVKFLFNKPEGIERLDKNLAFCQMFKEAQQRGTPFYADLENLACAPSAYVWGRDISEVYESGQFGAALKVFKEARANKRIYPYMPRLAPGVVNYIAFSPLDKLSFDPDLLIIITDNTSQTEIVLRAIIYTNGEMWSSEMTNVMGCAWIYAYPFVTGDLNYVTTGLSCGMKAKKVFPEGRQIISIPYNWLPTITQNLQEMEWVLPAYAADNIGEFVKRLYTELGVTPP